MTDAYRQRLLNWFCSMTLLLLVCSIALGLAWYRALINAYISGDVDFEKYAGAIAAGLMPYPLFFPALAFWHFCDFLESDRRADRWRGWFARYRSFGTLLLLSSPIAAIGGIEGAALIGRGGVFCDRPINHWHGCYPPGPMDTPLLLIVVPMISLACICKAMTAINSHIRRADD